MAYKGQRKYIRGSFSFALDTKHEGFSQSKRKKERKNYENYFLKIVFAEVGREVSNPLIFTSNFRKDCFSLARVRARACVCEV